MKTNKELRELYIWLRPRNCWTGEYIEVNDDFIELDFMPIGWRIAFGDKMCKELDKILKKANYQNEYRIMEIKEKYGELRWYSNSIPEKIWEEYSKWEDKYTKKSRHTCIVCGKRGKIDYKQYWLEPLCKKCRKEK